MGCVCSARMSAMRALRCIKSGAGGCVGECQLCSVEEDRYKICSIDFDNLWTVHRVILV